MDARLDLTASPTVARSVKYFAAASRVIIEDPALPTATRNLVMLRASQINGCGFCTDVHSKDAVVAGESPVRLALVAAGRETTVFTDAGRAALELTEQGTRIADSADGVSDEAWEKAAVHYDEHRLAALVTLISLINAATRMGRIARRAVYDGRRPGRARRTGQGGTPRHPGRSTSDQARCRRHPRASRTSAGRATPNAPRRSRPAAAAR